MMKRHEQELSSSSTLSNASTINSTIEGGLLSIKLVEARGLRLPHGVDVPPAVVSGFQAGGASSVPSGGGMPGGRKRESIVRQQYSYLPYLVLSFDNNEVLVDALGGTHANPSYMFSTSFDVSRHQRTDSGTSDIFLASTSFLPTFDARKVTDSWYKAIAPSLGAEFRIQITFKPTRHDPLTIDAFELLKVVGKGSFGKVMQVRKKDTGRIYALKTIRKAHIVSRSEVTHTLAERTVLAQVNNPFIVPLKFSFQSPEKLYLVLSFVNGGELFHHLQNEGKFSEERSRFYAAELLSALDHLHSFDVVYRDLKPENILIDLTGHLMLCDFGLCKLNMSENERTNTFAGTPEYLSPELILGEGYTRVVDWWTLGVLLYEMLTGLPPFFEEDHQKMYRRIVGEELKFPQGLAGEAKRICTALLQKNPEKRLGKNGAEEIRRHLFFHGLDWQALSTRRLQPPFRPNVESAVDTSNIEPDFLEEPAIDSFVEATPLSGSAQAQFEGFTYVADSALGESVR
ncbi:hypothetical protein MNV49_003568 [Pseudohyphozyma bogoriensis]|nr:hypothetical protein MNV49_003568 [Pseudohyphozyma bogoriensis]